MIYQGLDRECNRAADLINIITRLTKLYAIRGQYNFAKKHVLLFSPALLMLFCRHAQLDAWVARILHM